MIGWFAMTSMTQRLLGLFDFPSAPAPPKPAAKPARVPKVTSGFELLLASLISERLVLKWTDNYSTLLSFRRADGVIRLRLQRAFLQAGVREATALAALLQGKRNQTRVLQAFLNDHAALHKPVGPRTKQRLVSLGAHHDLKAYFDALNVAYFSGTCKSDITWGRASDRGRKRRRSMQLGCYVQQLGLIRIHPALDQGFVPDWVVRGVVFHEMLHEHMGTDESGPVRRMHPPAFRAKERAYPDYLRCVAWEKAHLGRLLLWRPAPRP